MGGPQRFGTLHDQALASYGWGTCHIALSRASVLTERRYLMEALAGFTTDTGVWANEAQFRSLAALLHESVHYQQDICTGIGHWDHIARARYRRGALTAFRDSTFFGESGFESGRQANQQLGLSSVFNSYALRATAALATLDAALGDVPDYDNQSNHLFTVPRLFELDAVLGTWSSLRQLKTSDVGAEIANAFSYLYSPFRMPPDYKETFEFFLYPFLKMFGITDDAGNQDTDGVIDKFLFSMPLFLDIAFAYPPPTYFEQHPGTQAHFEPGVRLIRIFRQSQIAPLTSTAKDASHLDWLDEGTRHTGAFDYPAVCDIYNAWADYFAPMVAADPIADWRRDVCQDRITKPIQYAYRHLENFVRHDLPLFIDLPGQEDVLYLTNRILRSEGSDLFWELVAIEKDFGLIDLFLSRGVTPFTCPLAKGGCDSSQPCCISITALHQLPNTQGCTVRMSLKASYFQFD
jgi:hypothetical protein